MGAGPGHMRLAPRAVDRAAGRPAVDGDARAPVPAMLPAEAGGGPGRPVGIDPGHDVADAAGARPLARGGRPVQAIRIHERLQKRQRMMVAPVHERTEARLPVPRHRRHGQSRKIHCGPGSPPSWTT